MWQHLRHCGGMERKLVGHQARHDLRSGSDLQRAFLREQPLLIDQKREQLELLTAGIDIFNKGSTIEKLVESLDHTSFLGSSASRNPSPTKLKLVTASVIASPGTIASHGALVRYVCALSSMFPQLGVGGWMPKPRKEM